MRMVVIIMIVMHRKTRNGRTSNQMLTMAMEMMFVLTLKVMEGNVGQTKRMSLGLVVYNSHFYYVAGLNWGTLHELYFNTTND